MNGVLIGAAVGFALCWVLLVLCIRRSYRQRMLDERLNAPLLADSTEHRLDAALRGAEEGYKACPVCGFENFKRFFFCNVCGAKLPRPRKRKTSAAASGDSDGDAASLPSASGADARAFMSLGSVRLVRSRADSDASASYQQLAEASACSEVSATSALAPSRAFTKRQRRARKRREWQRKVGVDGKVFWFRDGSCGSDLRFPGLVLRFHGVQEPPAAVAAEDAEHDDDAGGSSRSRDPFLEWRERDDRERLSSMQRRLSALEARLEAGRRNSEAAAGTHSAAAGDDHGDDTQGLHRGRHSTATWDVITPEAARESCSGMLKSVVATLEVELADASSADASKLAVARASSENVQWRDVLSHAGQVFPAKYAHFVTTTAGLINTTESVTVVINREQLLEDSIVGLAKLPAESVRTAMRVHFENEAGIDAGGLHREWFVLVNEQLVAPAAGVFRCVNSEEQTFYLNPNSLHDIGEHHLTYYYATGRLIGRALLEGDVLSFHLALPLLKIILGIPVTFADLEYFDPEAYKNMVWLLENDGVDSLGLDFSVTETRVKQRDTGKNESPRGDTEIESVDEDGAIQHDVEVTVVDLIPNGRNVDVTDANKREYLERKFRYLLFESVSSQLLVFLKGLYEVIPQELLMLFDPEEFDYLMCGSDEIDVDDWEKHTQTTIGLRGHPAHTWFWEIVREMPNEYRRRLLHFATGSSRVPIAGFSGLTSYDGRLCPFTLKGVRLVKDGYIWSHACFNRLDLPLHRDREQLKAVMYASVETELYGFTTY